MTLVGVYDTGVHTIPQNLALVSPKRLVLLCTQVAHPHHMCAYDTYSILIKHDTHQTKYLVRTWGYVHKQQYNTHQTELLLYDELRLPADSVLSSNDRDGY